MQDRERPETWTVRPGDNPWNIARRLYPDALDEDLPEIAMQIMEANAIVRPDALPADQVLMIPDRGLAVSEEVEAAVLGGAPADPAQQTDAAQAPLQTPSPFENLFVFGGGWDGYGPGLFRARNAETLSEVSFSGSTFINHRDYKADESAIVDQIVAQYEAMGQPIDLVGHSWGGMNAYDVALELSRRGVPVRTLVTVDPVGRRRRGDLPDEIDWINIAADHRNGFSLNNIVAAIGGKPSSLPITDADTNGIVAADHRDLGLMVTSPLTQAPERTRLERILGLTPDIDHLENPVTLPSANSALRRSSGP